MKNIFCSFSSSDGKLLFEQTFQKEIIIYHGVSHSGCCFDAFVDVYSTQVSLFIQEETNWKRE